MQKIKFALALVLLGLILVFVVQNLQVVEVKFLTNKWKLPVAIPLLVVYAAGAMSGRWLFRFLNARRQERNQISATKKAVKDEKDRDRDRD